MGDFRRLEDTSKYPFSGPFRGRFGATRGHFGANLHRRFGPGLSVQEDRVPHGGTRRGSAAPSTRSPPGPLRRTGISLRGGPRPLLGLAHGAGQGQAQQTHPQAEKGPGASCAPLRRTQSRRMRCGGIPRRTPSETRPGRLGRRSRCSIRSRSSKPSGRAWVTRTQAPCRARRAGACASYVRVPGGAASAPSIVRSRRTRSSSSRSARRRGLTRPASTRPSAERRSASRSSRLTKVDDVVADNRSVIVA
jgi:hypothetical protein